jgi:glycine/D-amino acid oxidase-like deaminating enzyme
MNSITIMKKVFDHVIVGGGLLGSSVAYHLSKVTGASASICIVERGSGTDYPTRGNSQYSTGLITSSHKTELGRSMVGQTFSDMHDLAELGFDPHFIQMGCVEVDLSNANDNNDNPTTPMQGILGNVLHFDEWHSTFAAGDAIPCAFEDFVVREQFRRDGVVSPTDLASCYLNAAKFLNSNLEIMFDSDVSTATGDARSAILTMTNGNVVEASNVVNAAGAWVDELGATTEQDNDEKGGVPIGKISFVFFSLFFLKYIIHVCALHVVRTHTVYSML